MFTSSLDLCPQLQTHLSICLFNFLPLDVCVTSTSNSACPRRSSWLSMMLVPCSLSISKNCWLLILVTQVIVTGAFSWSTSDPSAYPSTTWSRSGRWFCHTSFYPPTCPTKLPSPFPWIIALIPHFYLYFFPRKLSTQQEDNPLLIKLYDASFNFSPWMTF